MLGLLLPKGNNYYLKLYCCIVEKKNDYAVMCFNNVSIFYEKQKLLMMNYTTSKAVKQSSPLLEMRFSTVCRYVLMLQLFVHLLSAANKLSKMMTALNRRICTFEICFATLRMGTQSHQCTKTDKLLVHQICDV